MSNNYNITQWTEKERRIVWFIMSRSRNTLQISLSPTIATSFIMLQNYFRSNSYESTYKLLTLIASSLFSSCKYYNEKRSLDLIFSVLGKLCDTINSPILKKIIENIQFLDNYEIHPNEIELATRAELDILDSLEFNINIELPFNYIELWKPYLITQIPEKLRIQLFTNISIDICHIICSDNYLDLPPELTAAVAFFDSIEHEFPEFSIENNIIVNIKNRYGSDLFDVALNSLFNEKNKTVVQYRRI